jgi:hypothetical protein
MILTVTTLSVWLRALVKVMSRVGCKHQTRKLERLASLAMRIHNQLQRVTNYASPEFLHKQVHGQR